MEEEPSVLDYLKSKIIPWNKKKISLPFDQEDASSGEPSEKSIPQKPFSWPWRVICALVLALIAQFSLEPPDRNVGFGIFFYCASAGMLGWSLIFKEIVIAPLPETVAGTFSIHIRRSMLLISLPLILLSFAAFGGNNFTIINMFFWVITFIYLMIALWIPGRNFSWSWVKERFTNILKRPNLDIRFTPWSIVLFAAVLLAVFFRFYWLDRVPGEMFSDHAEKLLDVSDVLNGQYSIYFPRNTGREAIQMYLTAAIAVIFKTGLSFMSLKIGTALAGLFTLPFIYLLGKQIANRWVGLFAFVLAGIGYWPNLIARIGLRFPLYPMFVAPLLFFLIRGIRTSNRNDFILAGIALGLGLHGYSPFRIVPVIVVIAIGIYLVHAQSKGNRIQTVLSLFFLALISFVIFLPLFRYMLDQPDMFSYRALTRLGTVEKPFPEAAYLVFFSNLAKAYIMFFWDNGGIWVHSVVGRPALDAITAALYFLGTLLILVRYLRQRNWVDLFMLLSVPLLMLPSILSLAFPDENPSLNRTGGAIIPVFLIAAIALEAILVSCVNRAKGHRGGIILAVCLGLSLISWSSMRNFDLVFNQFNNQFMAGAWNTSEIGKIIRSFADSVGSPDSAYVVPYPYWVDTRLVGINAGYPTKDYALAPDVLQETLTETRAKLYILKDEDQLTLDKIKVIYPQGTGWLHQAARPGKNFWIYLVPPLPGTQP